MIFIKAPFALSIKTLNRGSPWASAFCSIGVLHIHPYRTVGRFICQVEPAACP